MKAKVIHDAISIIGAHIIDGEVVLETTCRDFDHFCALPAAVSFEEATGVPVCVCGKTGWSSDTNRACYKSGAKLAYKVVR